MKRVSGQRRVASRLVAVNVALAVLAGVCLSIVVRELKAPLLPDAVNPTRISSPPSAAPAPPPPTDAALIVARNIFSPTRSPGEVVVSPAPRPTGPPPLLIGVAAGDSALAYFQDPATKHVAAYRIGDEVAGGRIEAIDPDRVAIVRDDGRIELRLHESRGKPSRLRAAGAVDAPPAVAAVPAAPAEPVADLPAPALLPPPGERPPLAHR